MSRREERQTVESSGMLRAWPSWLEWCFVIGLILGGIGWDWYCAFEWFSGKYSLYSGPVFTRMSLIVMSCALVGFLAVRLRGGRWQVGVAVFFLTSGTVSGNILLWWIGHR
jgi:hypothetical protein